MIDSAHGNEKTLRPLSSNKRTALQPKIGLEISSTGATICHKRGTARTHTFSAGFEGELVWGRGS
eukprot:1157111-Pelagomonas_calceolata.AAC.8